MPTQFYNGPNFTGLTTTNNNIPNFHNEEFKPASASSPAAAFDPASAFAASFPAAMNMIYVPTADGYFYQAALDPYASASDSSLKDQSVGLASPSSTSSSTCSTMMQNPASAWPQQQPFYPTAEVSLDLHNEAGPQHKPT